MFREEVIKKGALSQHGAILLKRSFPSWLLFGVIVVTLLLVIIASFNITIAKRTSVKGQVIPQYGYIGIVPPAQGRVSSISVHDGDMVKKGQKLFVISSDRFLDSTDESLSYKAASTSDIEQQQKNILKEIENLNRLEQIELSSRNQKLRSINQDIVFTDEQISLTKTRILIGKNRLSEYERLNVDQTISNLKVQEQREALAAAEGQRLVYEKQRLELTRTAEDLTVQIQMQQRLAESKANQARKEIIQLNQKLTDTKLQGEWTIVAPVDGQFTSLNTFVGQVITNQTLGFVVPKTGVLKANLYVPSRSIGFMKNSAAVRIRYHAFPYQKFGVASGSIEYVSESPLPSEQLPQHLSLNASEPLFKVTVVLNSEKIADTYREYRILPGMLLDADVQVESRTIVEWMIEPLMSLRRYW